MKFKFTIGEDHPAPIPPEECKEKEYSYAYYWTIFSSIVNAGSVKEIMKEHGMIPQTADTLCLGVEWVGPKQSRVHMLSVRQSCEEDYHVCVFHASGHDGSDESGIKQFKAEFEEEDQIMLSLHEKGFFTPSFEIVSRRVIRSSDMPKEIAKVGEIEWDQSEQP